MEQNVDMNVTEKIVEIIEKFDLDFNTGNALLNLLSAEFTENPIQFLEKAIFLLDKRLKVLKSRQEQGIGIVKKNSDLVR